MSSISVVPRDAPSEDTLSPGQLRVLRAFGGSMVKPPRAVASAYRKAWWGGLWGSQEVCHGLFVNIIFMGRMFSAGGKRNNNCARTPHFHGWRIASTKATAFF